MKTFEVSDMTCGHCVGTIRNALTAVDPQAKVSIDLEARRVGVQSTRASAAQFQAAIQQAGYTPVPVESTDASTLSTGSGGCCCG